MVLGQEVVIEEMVVSCSVAKLCPALCDPIDCSTSGFPVLHSVLVCLNSSPLGQCCCPTISSSVTSFSQSFPASGSFPMSQLLASGGQSVGASASVLPVNIQGWFPLGWLVWSPCCPRESQQSSPATQFESFNSSGLSLLYGTTLTSVHDYWKNHSFG